MKILKEILQELVLIRKELQAIRSSVESNSLIAVDEKTISQAVRKSICDTVRATGYSSES